MGCDRISELPDPLLTHILSYLATKASLRTSVLSKRWESLWLGVPALDLYCEDFPPYGEVPDASSCYIDDYLEFNHKNKSPMHKFKVQYDAKSDYRERFVPWIETVVERGVQHLDVESHMDRYSRDGMTKKIYISKTLVSLKLANVCMSSVDPMLGVSLPCLKLMHLDDVWLVRDDPLFMEKLISGCPVLEDLALILPLDHCEGYPLGFSLRVRSQSLKSFLFALADNYTDDTDYSVEIDAPQLKYLDFNDYQSDRIVVKNLTSLSMIEFDTNFNVENGTTLQDLSKRAVISDFLTGISTVRHMIISQSTLEVLFLYSKLGPIPKFYNLYRLQAALSSSMLQLFTAFLDSFPNLKTLIMDFSVLRDCPFAGLFKLSRVPQCLTSNLECVEIKGVIEVNETVKKLVRYFLDNSVVLKKLILRFKDSSEANHYSAIFKELRTFTKLSPRCQIIIL